jgi:hypothetical protein
VLLIPHFPVCSLVDPHLLPVLFSPLVQHFPQGFVPDVATNSRVVGDSMVEFAVVCVVVDEYDELAEFVHFRSPADDPGLPHFARRAEESHGQT